MEAVHAARGCFYFGAPSCSNSSNLLALGTKDSVGSPVNIKAGGISKHRKQNFHSLGELNRQRNQTCNEISLSREVIEMARMDVYALRGQ